MFRAPLQHNTVAEGWQFGRQLHVPCRESSKKFSFPVNYNSVIPYSAFYSVPNVCNQAPLV